MFRRHDKGNTNLVKLMDPVESLSQFLTANQCKALHALCDLIVPEDDFPSAWQAGAGAYIARVLHNEPETAELVGSGLRSLDEEAVRRSAPDFAGMSLMEQDRLFRDLESGVVSAAWMVDPVEFATRMVELAAESFYADPANGGNRGEVSWKMVGFEVTA